MIRVHPQPNGLAPQHAADVQNHLASFSNEQLVWALEMIHCARTSIYEAVVYETLKALQFVSVEKGGISPPGRSRSWLGRRNYMC